MAVLRHADSAVVREMTVQVVAQAITAHPRGMGSGAAPASGATVPGALQVKTRHRSLQSCSPGWGPVTCVPSLVLLAHCPTGMLKSTWLQDAAYNVSPNPMWFSRGSQPWQLLPLFPSVLQIAS